MGRDVVAVDAVPPGNIFGVLGLEGCIMKSGTLSDTPNCPSLSSLRFAVCEYESFHAQSDPIVQIAVETEKSSDMPLLLRQLEILNNNDNSIRVTSSVASFDTPHP